MVSSIISQPDLGDRVYEIVRDQILTSALPPGSELSLTRLARLLGVSITPVRDALHRLEAEKLVVEVPRKGYFVTKLEAQDIAHLMEARLIIEQAAVERGLARVTPAEIAEMRRLLQEMDELRSRDYIAYSKRDYDFHQLIVGTARNPQLVEMHRTLGHVRAHRLIFRAKTVEQSGSAAMQEHRAMVEAIQTRDLASLKQIIAQHIDRTIQQLLSGISGSP
ncbi:MAG: GntR family transcriptional regulator [Chloroflexota bacterium]